MVPQHGKKYRDKWYQCYVCIENMATNRKIESQQYQYYLCRCQKNGVVVLLHLG